MRSHLEREEKTTRREQNERISKIGKKRIGDSKLGTIWQFEEDCAVRARSSNTSSSSSTHVHLEHFASGEKQYRPEPMCVQNSSHVDGETHISSLDVSTRWMDETIVTSKKCSIGLEMP